MFSQFFYHLRTRKVPVSTGEYLDFLKALGHVSGKDQDFNIKKFFTLARHTLIKDLKHYDAFEVAFSEIFGELISGDDAFRRQLEEWLKKAKETELSEERKQNALRIPPKDLLKELQKRLKEQKKRHDGGNKWVGTGGTSPFGNSGFNPDGLRIGGSGGGRSALAVLGERKYQAYRSDEILGVRQVKVALKKLRQLKKRGRPELSIKKTIRKTCDNAGEIELILESTRKNNLKLVLLMDIGGSMDPHAQRVEQLFSAAHQLNHFKQFESYFFHNIFYDRLYKDHQLYNRNSLAIEKIYKRFSKDTRVIILGDASMAPYELFNITGNVMDFYYYGNSPSGAELEGKEFTGIDRVKQFKQKFPNIVWLNPEPEYMWGGTTIAAIKEHIPMYYLSLDGLNSGIKCLLNT